MTDDRLEKVRAEVERRLIETDCFSDISVYESLLDFIDSLQEQELEGIQKEVVEGTIARIDRKRIPIELKGAIKAKFRNEFNTI